MAKKTTPKTKEDNGEYLLNLFNNLNPKTKSTLTKCGLVRVIISTKEKKKTN